MGPFALLVTLPFACILFDIDSGLAIKWSKVLGAWILESDWREGKDYWPGYQAPVLRPDWSRKKAELEVPKELVRAKWGLQPKQRKSGWPEKAKWGVRNAYNARSETVTSKPTFSDAFAKRRCIVLATHYYEPLEGIQVDEAGEFVPHDGEGGNRRAKFSSTESEVMFMAGLWEPFHPREDIPDAEKADTFTIVTTEANLFVAPAQDRMPVLLRPEDVDAWMDLDTPFEHLRALMTPAPEGLLKVEDGGSMRRKTEVDGPKHRKAPKDDEPTLF